MSDDTAPGPTAPATFRPPVDVVVDARSHTGESPTWCAADSALWWIDVKAPALHRTAHPDGSTRTWALPWDVGGFALCPDADGVPRAALLALRLGLCRLELASGRLAPVTDAPFDPRTHRFNESGCDASGRLWLGTIYEPPDGYATEPAPDALHSWAPDEGLRRHEVRPMAANGFAWSADGRGFYAADTSAGTIDRHDFDPATGRVGEPARFARVEPELGAPDGAALDVEGAYWCAVYGGGRLRRYLPDGRLEREVLLPVDNPTKPAFAGPDLDVLYVTSATGGDRRARAKAGALLRLRPGVRGAPVHGLRHAGRVDRTGTTPTSATPRPSTLATRPSRQTRSGSRATRPSKDPSAARTGTR